MVHPSVHETDRPGASFSPGGAAAMLPASVLETHISVVMCLGDRAYKLKKPVRFPFVDQSTPERRLALCRHEVERNRRLAPDVYLGVADVLGPHGDPCEHLVVMRRMSDDRRLARLVGDDDPRVVHGLEELAELVARFHDDARRSPEIAAAATADRVLELWRDNAAAMRPFDGTILPPGAVDDTLRRAERFLDGRRSVFEDRATGGWICDGHGDLLASDIFLLDDGPRVLDCIDFDDRLAYVDVASDVAFLAMDLERLGRPDLATAWVASYEHASGASIPSALLHHYIAYRAQVRAKVTSLRADQSGDPGDLEEARRLIGLCGHHLRAGVPRLVIVGGAPGTGKTTVATALCDHLGWNLIRSDVERKADVAPGASSELSWNQGLYAPERTAAVYRDMTEKAGDLLRRGESVMLDATFSSEEQRTLARQLAERVGGELLELRCALAPAERDRRIRSRRAGGHDASDADPGIAARLEAATDPWPEATELSTAGTRGSVEAAAVHLVEAWLDA